MLNHCKRGRMASKSSSVTSVRVYVPPNSNPFLSLSSLYLSVCVCVYISICVVLKLKSNQRIHGIWSPFSEEPDAKQSWENVGFRIEQSLGPGSGGKEKQTQKTKERRKMRGEGFELEGRVCEEFSAGYYGICTVGGMLSAGTAHLAITPLDVLKVNMQVNPVKYNGISAGLSILWKEQGPSALWRGWSGKFFGYGVQGGCKFGLYEYFKKLYSDMLGDHNGSAIFFVSSASAQVFADMALCPFEAVKVRVQAQPSFAKGLVDGIPKLYANEGLPGFYRGLLPLWGRNLPFSMVMFSTFEHSVDLIYRNVIKRRKEDCSMAQQLGVTCLSGYAAGTVGAMISNPADNIVSFIYNNKKGPTVIQAVKSIGLLNLFTRSLPIRMTLVGPVLTMQWFLYDAFKVFSGLPTSGGFSRRMEEVKCRDLGM